MLTLTVLDFVWVYYAIVKQSDNVFCVVFF